MYTTCVHKPVSALLPKKMHLPTPFRLIKSKINCLAKLKKLMQNWEQNEKLPKKLSKSHEIKQKNEKPQKLIRQTLN